MKTKTLLLSSMFLCLISIANGQTKLTSSKNDSKPPEPKPLIYSYNSDGSVNSRLYQKVRYRKSEIVYENNEISVYPNPFSNLINISIEGDEQNASYYVYNDLGQLIKKGQLKSKQNEIDLSELSKGIYFISLEEHNKQQVKKIVKQ